MLLKHKTLRNPFYVELRSTWERTDAIPKVGKARVRFGSVTHDNIIEIQHIKISDYMINLRNLGTFLNVLGHCSSPMYFSKEISEINHN